MKKPAYNPNLHGCFNHNIEIIRDIVKTIGTGKMANAYNILSFGMNENNRIVVMIEGRSYNEFQVNRKIVPKYICVEYQGDGICDIEPTDAHGNPIDDTNNFNKLFDTHCASLKKSSEVLFKEHLKTKFDFIF